MNVLEVYEKCYKLLRLPVDQDCQVFRDPKLTGTGAIHERSGSIGPGKSWMNTGSRDLSCFSRML